MAPGFSPLDEALGLSAHSPYPPRVLGWLVRLGAELPFARAAFWVGELAGVTVSAATVRRQTEAVGATAVAEAEADVDRLEREAPVPPVAPQRLVIGADGAMVLLVGGEWVEVKLLSIGEPGPRPAALSGAAVRTQHVSYFARLADAATFATQALGEVHRRGVEAAGAVAAVQDGARWLQGMVDLHRPDALRILDFAHAAEHLSAVVVHLFGEGTARTVRLARRLRGWLWEQGPDRVLRILAAWVRARPHDEELARAVAYFTERRAQLAYPAFRTAGWPVGSGATESGHKQVMQARMKRAGMRWARAHVNPLLALSLLEHNGRWATEGPSLLHAHHARCAQQRRTRQHAQRQARRPLPSPASSTPCPVTSAPPSRHHPPRQTSPTPHPWRRYGAPLSVIN